MRLVLAWPVRLLVIGLLIFTLVVDGWGIWYRVINHYPLTGFAPGMPPTINGATLFVHRGLDLSGGTHLELQMSNFPPGQGRSTVQQETIAVIQNRVNALGTSEPLVEPAGNNNDRIIVELAGVGAAQAQEVIGQTAQLVTTKWVADASITAGPRPGYRPQITDLTSSELTSASASLDSQTSTQWVVNLAYNASGASKFGTLTTQAVAACPGANDCPQRHIAQWLDLTRADIDTWNTSAGRLYQPYGQAQGGKLLNDAYIETPITGGQAVISGGFTQTSAKDRKSVV